MRERINQALERALPGVALVVERPASMAHGDYATNAALVAKVDAQELASKLKIEGVERTEVKGKFINFFLTREELIPKERSIPKLYAGKKIMVEYTDPNPFKEFHIGHLMSNAIGESVARLLEHTGAQVSRANYQGDVGPHVAKAIWGKLQKPTAGWGEAYAYGEKEYESHKADIDALNKKIYERDDAEINKLYDAGRAESLKHFEEIYKKLGTKFDHYFFESESGPLGLKLIEKHADIFEKSDGATVFRGKHTRVFITGAGLPTYEAKELGLTELKQEKAPADLYLTITANEQVGFFEVVFEAIKKIFPALEGKLVHRPHGMMRFTAGKMSSRKGNVITGESLLAELIAGAHKKMQDRKLTDADKVAEQVAVGAVKYAVLKQGSGRDITFDPEKSLSLEGDSGPYLQYARVRACSLIREAQKAGIEASATDAPPEATELERALIHFPEVLARAASEYEPHYATTYLTELAGSFNSWYAQVRLIGGPYPSYALLLTQAVEQTLSKGLQALGIPAPEEM